MSTHRAHAPPALRAQIHWFSIFNSSMMVIFLTGLVAMILMRTLRADYARYTARDEDDLEVRNPKPYPSAPPSRPQEQTGGRCLCGAAAGRRCVGASGLLQPWCQACMRGQRAGAGAECPECWYAAQQAQLFCYV